MGKRGDVRRFIDGVFRQNVAHTLFLDYAGTKAGSRVELTFSACACPDIRPGFCTDIADNTSLLPFDAKVKTLTRRDLCFSAQARLCCNFLR